MHQHSFQNKKFCIQIPFQPFIIFLCILIILLSFKLIYLEIKYDPMINWNPFKTNTNPNPMHGTGVQITGPGSNNVKVIDLSNNGNNEEIQIIMGHHPQAKKTVQTEIPMYGQNLNFGFIPVQSPYQQAPYQVQCQSTYKAPYQVLQHQASKPPQYNRNQNYSSNLYPDLSGNTNPYSQFPKQSAKQLQSYNPYAQEYAKENKKQTTSGNPYY